MKLSLFSTKEQRTEYCNRMADAIENNGLKQAIEAYKDAQAGCGREAFLKINNISDKNADSEWEHHIAWLWSQVSYLKKQVRKYRKMAQEA